MKLALLAGAAACGFSSVVAHAELSDGVRSDDSSAPVSLTQRAGGYLALIPSASVGSAAAFGAVLGGYDSAHDAAVMASFAEARLLPRLSLRLGAQSRHDAQRLGPNVGMRLQVLRQESQGVAASIGLAYKAEGFNELEGEIEGVAALGQLWDRWGWLASVGYGQDPEGNERDAEIGAAVLLNANRRLSIGGEARARFDLGSKEGQRRESGEAVFDLDAGPTMNWALGPVCFAAHGGIALLQRVDQNSHVGWLALGGVGTAF